MPPKGWWMRVSGWAGRLKTSNVLMAGTAHMSQTAAEDFGWWQVASLAAMAAATNSEVTMQHLGPRFAAAMGQERLDREMAGG